MLVLKKIGQVKVKNGLFQNRLSKRGIEDVIASKKNEKRAVYFETKKGIK